MDERTKLAIIALTNFEMDATRPLLEEQQSLYSMTRSSMDRFAEHSSAACAK